MNGSHPEIRRLRKTALTRYVGAVYFEKYSPERMNPSNFTYNDKIAEKLLKI